MKKFTLIFVCLTFQFLSVAKNNDIIQCSFDFQAKTYDIHNSFIIEKDNEYKILLSSYQNHNLMEMIKKAYEFPWLNIKDSESLVRAQLIPFCINGIMKI